MTSFQFEILLIHLDNLQEAAFQINLISDSQSASYCGIGGEQKVETMAAAKEISQDAVVGHIDGIK